MRKDPLGHAGDLPASPQVKGGHFFNQSNFPVVQNRAAAYPDPVSAFDGYVSLCQFFFIGIVGIIQKII